MDQKQQYFISVARGNISQVPNAQDNDFTIMATRKEANELRRIFDNMDKADNMSHIRATIPILPYHNDQANEQYDHEITEAFKMIYELGDHEARAHIEESGVLSDRPIKTSDKL